AFTNSEVYICSKSDSGVRWEFRVIESWLFSLFIFVGILRFAPGYRTQALTRGAAAAGNGPENQVGRNKQNMSVAVAPKAAFPPGPKFRFPASSLVRFKRDPLAFLTWLAREYGDVAHFKLGPNNIFALNNPNYIRDVLVTNNKAFKKSRGLQVAKRFLGEGLLTSETEFHRRQRRLVQPAFHPERIAGYAQTMIDYGTRLADRWTGGESLDIAAQMMELTLAIVAKTLFDADVEGEAGEIRDAITRIMRMFTFTLNMPFAELFERMPFGPKARFERARARLDATIYRIINERRKGGVDRGDLLSMLLMAQDEEDNSQMTDLQVRDEAMTLFLAGHETTANALTWTWYLLSQNPGAESKLHEEIDSVLGGAPPSPSDFRKLVYTEMVFREAMRLYPPAWVMGRQALADYEIGEYVIPAGSTLLMSQFVMHRNPRYYSDPSDFRPERWTPEARAALPRFAYFPFGGGSRTCIGEDFAWMEGVLLIATIARKWRMRLVPGQHVTTRPLITLRPKDGVRVRLERR
ncbi:MAG TPA: cytochrome P450, partial [Blastocatellia bacterium]|nr:cytochrome P450 [Blastocatellia bacterium]